MDIHYWRNSSERSAFFRSATFTLTWNGLRKGVRDGMERNGIKSIKIRSERGDDDGDTEEADV